MKPQIAWKAARWVALIGALGIFVQNVFFSNHHYSPIVKLLRGIVDAMLAYGITYLFWGAVFWVVLWVISKAVNILSKAIRRFRVSSKDDHTEL